MKNHLKIIYDDTRRVLHKSTKFRKLWPYFGGTPSGLSDFEEELLDDPDGVAPGCYGMDPETGVDVILFMEHDVMYAQPTDTWLTIIDDEIWAVKDLKGREEYEGSAF